MVNANFNLPSILKVSVRYKRITSSLVSIRKHFRPCFKLQRFTVRFLDIVRWIQIKSSLNVEAQSHKTQPQLVREYKRQSARLNSADEA